MSRRALHSPDSPPKLRPAPAAATALLAALRQVEIAVDAFNREADRIHDRYGIDVVPEMVFNTPEETGLDYFIEEAIAIVERKLPVAATYVASDQRWTGAQSPQQVIGLHKTAGENTVNYLTQMSVNEQQAKSKQDSLERSLKTVCGRPKKNGDPCQTRPLYQAAVGHQDGFGCRHHVTAEEKKTLEQSRVAIEAETACPGCRAVPGEACFIPADGGLSPSEAGLAMVDGEWPRVRVLGGVVIHVPRIELVHPSST